MTEQTPANTKSSIKISEGSGKSNPGSMLKSIAKKVLSNNRTQITPDSQNNNEGNSLLANAINNLVSTIRPGSLGEGSPNPFTGMSGFGTDPGSMTPDGIETAKYLENDSDSEEEEEKVAAQQANHRHGARKTSFFGKPDKQGLGTGNNVLSFGTKKGDPTGSRNIFKASPSSVIKLNMRSISESPGDTPDSPGQNSENFHTRNLVSQKKNTANSARNFSPGKGIDQTGGESPRNQSFDIDGSGGGRGLNRWKTASKKILGFDANNDMASNDLGRLNSAKNSNSGLRKNDSIKGPAKGLQGSGTIAGNSNKLSRPGTLASGIGGLLGLRMGNSNTPEQPKSNSKQFGFNESGTNAFKGGESGPKGFCLSRSGTNNFAQPKAFDRSGTIALQQAQQQQKGFNRSGTSNKISFRSADMQGAQAQLMQNASGIKDFMLKRTANLIGNALMGNKSGMLGNLQVDNTSSDMNSMLSGQPSYIIMNNGEIYPSDMSQAQSPMLPWSNQSYQKRRTNEFSEGSGMDSRQFTPDVEDDQKMGLRRKDTTYMKVFGKRFTKRIRVNYDNMSKDEQIVNAVNTNDVHVLGNILKVYPSTVWNQLKDKEGRD